MQTLKLSWMGKVNTFIDSLSAVSPIISSDGEEYVPPRNQQSSDTGANDGNYTQLHSLVSLLDNYPHLYYNSGKSSVCLFVCLCGAKLLRDRWSD